MNKRGFLKTLAGVAGALLALPVAAKSSYRWPAIYRARTQAIPEVPRGMMIDYGGSGWVGGIRLPLSRYPIVQTTDKIVFQWNGTAFDPLSMEDLTAIARGEYTAAFEFSRQHHV